MTNFDLTFCQVWYDGDTVRSTHPLDIINKQGTLQPEYQEAFHKYSNTFIVERIKKYTARGFKINVGNNAEYHIFELKPPKSYRISPEEWVVKKIYKYYISYMIPYNEDEEARMYTKLNFICTNPLVEYTMAALSRFGIPIDDERIRIGIWLNMIEGINRENPDVDADDIILIAEPFMGYITRILGTTDVQLKDAYRAYRRFRVEERARERREQRAQRAQRAQREVGDVLELNEEEVQLLHLFLPPRFNPTQALDLQLYRPVVHHDISLYNEEIHLLDRKRYRDLASVLWKNPLYVPEPDASVCMQVHNAVKALLNPLYAYSILQTYHQRHPRGPMLSDQNLLLHFRNILHTALVGNSIFNSKSPDDEKYDSNAAEKEENRRKYHLKILLIDQLLKQLNYSFSETIQLHGNMGIREPYDEERVVFEISARELVQLVLYFMIDQEQETISNWCSSFVTESITAYQDGLNAIESYEYGQQISCPGGIVERMMLHMGTILCPEAPEVVYASNLALEWFPEFQKSLETDVDLPADASLWQQFMEGKIAVDDLPEEEQAEARRRRDGLWQQFIDRKLVGKSELYRQVVMTVIGRNEAQLNAAKYGGIKKRKERKEKRHSKHTKRGIKKSKYKGRPNTKKVTINKITKTKRNSKYK